MTERIALVTGANKGIGREISRQLASKGVYVLMGARDRGRGEQAAYELHSEGLPVEWVHMDVASDDSVEWARQEVEARHGRIDILVNNAGIAIDWFSPVELSATDLQKTFDTNVFGVFRVTKAMIPLLKKSKHGRIVNISSTLGSLSLAADPNATLGVRNILLAYCSSKAALNMMTIQFASLLKDSGIKVNSANPGYTATDMNQNRGVRTVQQAAVTPVRLALLPDDGPTAGVFSDDGAEQW